MISVKQYAGMKIQAVAVKQSTQSRKNALQKIMTGHSLCTSTYSKGVFSNFAPILNMMPLKVWSSWSGVLATRWPSVLNVV